MDDLSQFLVLRYSLVEESQHVLSVEPLPATKGRAAEIALRGEREFSANNVEYVFIGFSEIQPTPGYSIPPGRYTVGKIAKLRKAHVGERVPGDIIEHETDDWIPLVAVVDYEQQYIFVQRNWKFGTESQIARAIQAGLRPPVLAKYNHRVFVETTTRKEDFWNVIREHKKVYRLELKLISPNILQTNEKAREALEKLKELYGQEEVSVVLENESGELSVPEDPVSDYVDYIAEGEGKWEIVTEGDKGKKKKHTSEQASVTVELPVPGERELYEAGQLEFRTGQIAPARATEDVRLVAEVIAESEKLKRE